MHTDVPIQMNFPEILKDKLKPESSCGLEQRFKNFGNRYGSSSVGSGN